MNPILLALKQVAGLVGDLNSRAAQWSIKEDFKSLWGLPPKPTEPPDEPDLWIVLADGLPARRLSDGVDVGRYLSPYDWAVGKTLSSAVDSKIVPRIIIFDQSISSELTSKDPNSPQRSYGLSSTPKTDSERFFAAASRRCSPYLPSVCVVGPVGNGNAVGTVIDLLALLGQEKFPDQTDNREYVRRVWRAALTQPAVPDDHHAIANLVGPMALSDEKFWDADDRAIFAKRNATSITLSDEGLWDTHAQALRRLLRQLDLFPDQGSDADSRIFGWSLPYIEGVLKEFPQPDKPIRLLLLDDMAVRQHWAKILGWALRLKVPAVSDSELPLLFAENQVGHLKFELRASDFPDSMKKLFAGDATLLPDVLYLDLRLFQATSPDLEASFSLDLIEQAQAYLVSEPSEGKQPLPWPGFTAHELSRMRAWTQAKVRGDNPDYHLVLCLPARLLALKHPRLPIILFSTTARRRIIECLKPYGTIFTALAKPNFPTPDGKQLLAEFHERLWRTLGTALEIAAGKRVIDGAYATSAASPKIALPTHAPFYSEQGTYLAELFLDEKGRLPDPLTVAGLLLIFPANATVATVNAFHNRFKQKYFDWKNHRETSYSDFKAWLNEERAEDIANNLEGYFDRREVFSAVVSVEGAPNKGLYSGISNSDDLRDERVGDNLNRHLIRQVIDLAVYGVARRQIPPGVELRFSVFGATRWGLLDQQRAEEHAIQLWLRFGIRVQWEGSLAKLWNALDAIESFRREQKSPTVELKWILDPLEAALEAREAFKASVATIAQHSDLSRKIRWTEEHSIGPLVEEVMQKYHGSFFFSPTLDIARAFRINKEKQVRNEKGRTIHAFADWVNKQRPWLEKLKSRGCREDHGETLRDTLKAHKFFLQDRLPEAMATLEIALRQRTEFGEWFADELIQQVRRLGGREFLRYCRFRKERPQWDQDTRPLRGTVIDVADNPRLKIDGGRFMGIEPYISRGFVDNLGLKIGSRVSFMPVRHAIPGRWEAHSVKLLKNQRR